MAAKKGTLLLITFVDCLFDPGCIRLSNLRSSTHITLMSSLKESMSMLHTFETQPSKHVKPTEPPAVKKHSLSHQSLQQLPRWRLAGHWASDVCLLHSPMPEGRANEVEIKLVLSQNSYKWGLELGSVKGRKQRVCRWKFWTTSERPRKLKAKN